MGSAGSFGRRESRRRWESETEGTARTGPLQRPTRPRSHVTPRFSARLRPMSDARPAHASPPDAPDPSGSPRVNALVRLVEGEPGRKTLRILSLGAAAAPLAAILRSRGHEVVEPRADTSTASLSEIARSEPGTFDVALAIGFVERLRWDRWGLQRIHRALRQGGTLLLAVPDLYSLRSLANPRYVAAKLAKILPRTGAGVAARPREAVRSYPVGRLRETLARLGFEPQQWSRIGIRLQEGALASTWPPSHHLVLARARAATVAAEEAADPRRFEAEHRSFLALRERWRRDEALGSEAQRAFEPERYAGGRAMGLDNNSDDDTI